ncbi:MAG TPA: hypothetical protein VEF06_10595 [Bryobacteraceae bacterium]|nr:hypothetical protein [Bryobacteraceae bacterium]
MTRILAAATLALAFAGCGKAPDSPDGSAPAGFFSAASQFLELDNSTPTGSSGSTSASASAQDSSAGQALTRFLELDTQAPSAGAAPAAARSGGRSAHAGIAADLDGLTEQIRNIYGDASAFVDGFPQAEDSFRNVPTRYREQVAKVQGGKVQLPADVIHRRIADLSRLALEAIEHQHERFATVRDTFDQRFGAIMKSAGALEQTCARLPKSADPEDAQACTRFLDADTMIKTKGQLVNSGFAHLEDVYKEVRQYQTDLNTETLNGK